MSKSEFVTPETVAESSAAPQPVDPAIVDLAVLADMLDGNTTEMQRFAQLFITAMQQGLEDINVALSKKDWATLKLVAHRIKSPAKTVGAFGFAAICETLEQLTEPDALASATALRDQLQRVFAQVVDTLNNQFPAT